MSWSHDGECENKDIVEACKTGRSSCTDASLLYRFITNQTRDKLDAKSCPD